MEDHIKLKIGAIFISIFECLVFGFMPVYLYKYMKGSVMQVLNAFAGGALICISMMHLLADANLRFEIQIDLAYPIPFFILVMSFSIILGIHSLVDPGHAHEEEEQKDEKKELEDAKPEEQKGDLQGVEQAQNQSNEQQGKNKDPLTNPENNQEGEQKQSEIEMKQIKIEISKEQEQQEKKEEKLQGAQTALSELQIEEHKEVKATMMGIVLCCSLTVYGIIFGIGLGQAENYKDTALLTANLCGHKWVDVVCCVSFNSEYLTSKRQDKCLNHLYMPSYFTFSFTSRNYSWNLY